MHGPAVVRACMKLLAVLAVLSLAAFVVPTADARPDPSDAPVCVGYSWCYDATGNGFAVFCVKWKGTWVCGECEACGNGPWLS